LYKIRWEKHYRAFVKVVEDSEIYNFSIHHLVHFSWEILRKTRSNRGTLKRWGAPAPRPLPRRSRPHARLPNAPRPETPWVLRCAVRRSPVAPDQPDARHVGPPVLRGVPSLCVVPRQLIRRPSSSTCVAYKRLSPLHRALEHRRACLLPVRRRVPVSCRRRSSRLHTARSRVTYPDLL
jgi:hypothetical protein